MSNAVLTRVWTQSKQIKNHRLLLVALADGVNDHGVGWHGTEYLAEKVLLSERQTKRLRDDLEASGEIYTRLGNGRGIKTQYLICTGLDESQITFALENYFDMESETAKNVTLSIIEKRVTFLSKRVTKSNIKGDKKREKGDTVERKTPTTINHKNHITFPSPAATGEVSKPRERNLVFDAIALGSFSMPVVPKGKGGRVAALCKAVTECSDQSRLGTLGADLTAMYVWYKKTYPQLSPPAAVETICKYLAEYRQSSAARPKEVYTIVEPEIYISETEAA